MQSLAIMVIGAGKIGRESGQQLIDAGHRLTFVEKNHQEAENARKLFAGQVIQGDGCDPKVLELAGIAQIQVIIAATGDDEDNLIVAELAHHVFGVQHVITRVNRVENQWLFTAHRGVETSFCLASMAADFLKREIDNKTTKM